MKTKFQFKIRTKTIRYWKEIVPQHIVTFATTNTSMWLFLLYSYGKGIRTIDNSLISMQFVSGNSVRYMHVGH